MNKFDLLKELFKKSEINTKSILLIGRYGIGKSSIIYDYANERARELNRELKIWHQLNEKEKYQIINNLEKYFVLVDIKGSMISPENIILPFLKNDNLIWEIPLWAKVFENENSAGILFIDEINMTPARLQGLLFELILQRKIAEASLKSKNLLIIAAANDLEYNEAASEIPTPLINRFIVVHADEILLDIDRWIKYAAGKNIDKRLIDYILYKNRLFTKGESMKQSTTPRTLEMLSDLIKDSNNLEYINFVANTLLEEKDSLEFSVFISLYDKLKDLDQYINNFDKFKELEEDQQYIVAIKLSERFIDNTLSLENFIKFLINLSNYKRELLLILLKKVKYESQLKYKELLDQIITRSDTFVIREMIIKFGEFYNE